LLRLESLSVVLVVAARVVVLSADVVVVSDAVVVVSAGVVVVSVTVVVVFPDVVVLSAAVVVVSDSDVHSVPEKKQPLCFLVITSANINRFSKFFHRQIPKKTG